MKVVKRNKSNIILNNPILFLNKKIKALGRYITIRLLKRIPWLS